MGVTTDRPQLFWQLSFNADPNDIGAVPLWTDVTSKVRKVGRNRRGRQYELAESIAAMPIITWRDPDEYLNPANTSSPYYPNVQPYRQLLGQAMWPNPAQAGGLGSAVNLINSGRWKGNNEVAPDPSFESYANGAALPGWLTAVGGTVPTITTTNPQQGTKSLTYTVAATATRQGVSWSADCVPGQQYTTSAYMRQSTGSTQRLLVGDQTLAYDNFGRTSSNGWGTADFGGAWSTSGGSASDYSVGSGVGKHSIGTLNVQRFTVVGNTFADANAYIQITIPTDVTGGASDTVRAGLVARYVDANNHYKAEVNFKTSSVLTIEITKVVAGTPTSLASLTSTSTYAAGDTWNLRLQVAETTVRARLWKSTALEPTTWDVSATDTALSAVGAIGATSFASSGVTNTLPVVISFDALMMSGSTSSTTTTTSGSYVRLTQTFTATQPKHTISVSTLGTATAGTINIDAIQHEIGASASAFSTTGPVIYPLMRPYVERWPRTYEAAGFLGMAVTPAVDGFGALAAIGIYTDYVAAVLDTKPNYFWTLGGGPETLQAVDISGNGGPSLSRFDSKYGAGNPPAFGSSITIAGDAGGTGVHFQDTAAGGTNVADSILSLGRATPGLSSFPHYNSTTWGASVAAWVSIENNHAYTQQVAAPLSNVSTGIATVPVALTVVTFLDGTFDASAVSQSPTTGTTTATSTSGYTTDAAHLLVGTVTQTNGGNTTVSIYVDGVFANSTTVTTASLGGQYTSNATLMNVGGNSIGGNVVDGVVAHVALWERALSASEITALWNAGGLGNAGELSGARILRHLASGRYAGATRISAGLSAMEAPSWVGAIDLLTDSQNTAVAEMGTLWVAPDGALVMEGRQDRWLRLTSIGTFGENVAGGETPYQEGVVFDYDPTFVYADVRITRNGGSIARGGLIGDINTVARKFFPRSFAASVDLQTDTLAQNYADYTFYTHRAPLQRVSEIIIDPSSNPSLWPVALSREIGQRVTVKRRAKAANAGAGLTMSADYFIEAVEHSEINMDTGAWFVGFLLSPIGTVPGPSLQPWILEDATYGVLDSTTILGW